MISSRLCLVNKHYLTQLASLSNSSIVLLGPFHNDYCKKLGKLHKMICFCDVIESGSTSAQMG